MAIRRAIPASLIPASLILAAVPYLAASAASAGDTVSDGAPRPRVGLVLSGGGAKGIAHVGVIKALEENDIPIDCVAGTSMGAVVGSLYSCGWSPDEMMEFFTSTQFLDCSTGTVDPALTYYFGRPEPTPEWVGLNLSLRKPDNLLDEVLPAALVNPAPMSIEFLELFTPYTAACRGSFDRLFVPFRCVTSDIYHKHKIVLSEGALGDAVRASMSFPLVYKPIEMDGVLVYDGGIYDNFPVDVMHRDFNPELMIGVSVSAPDSKPEAGNIYSQLEDMIIQNNDYDLPAEWGIKIQVPVLDFGVLDFPDAERIYGIGYRTGLAMVDSIRSRTAARRGAAEVSRRRADFAATVPVIEYDSVSVTGARGAQARYLAFLFDRGLDRPFGMEQTRLAYYRAIGDDKLTELFPQTRIRSYIPDRVELPDRRRGTGRPGPEPRRMELAGAGDGGFRFDSVVGRPVLSRNTLMLTARVKNPWSVGAGGWITSSANSMLYLTAGYHTLSLNSLDLDLSGWIGQSYYAGMLSARFTLHSRIPSALQLVGVMSRQKYYDSELLFYEDATPSFISSCENYVRLNYTAALGRQGRGFAAVGYGHQSDRYYPEDVTDFAGVARDKGLYRIAMAGAGAEWNTLDNSMYPSSGRFLNVNAALVHEDSRTLPRDDASLSRGWSGRWRGSVEARWKHFLPLHGNLTLGVAAHGLATFGELCQDYTATLVHAYGFAPTPSTASCFNPAFRSDNFVAVGLMPVWRPMGRLQLRGDFYGYSAARRLVPGSSPGATARYDGWFRRVEFIGEIAAVYNFPFASLSLYGNYLSSPARDWNFGINFGLFFRAPRFVR